MRLHRTASDSFGFRIGGGWISGEFSILGIGKGFLDYRDVLDLLVLSLTEEYFFLFYQMQIMKMKKKIK